MQERKKIEQQASQLKDQDANLTDLVRLGADHLKGKVAYAEELGTWYHWSGTHWVPDPNKSGVTRASLDFFDEVRYQGATDPAMQQLAKRAHAAGNGRADSFLALLQPFVAVSASIFDQDPDLLNTPNGTVHLPTGELQPHDKDDYITRITPVKFNPDARAPRFLKVMRDASCGDSALFRYKLLLFASTLNGHNGEPYVHFFTGFGANGKTTEFEAVEASVGQGYVGRLSTDALAKQKRESELYMQPFVENRLVIASEPPKGATIQDSFLKQVTNGRAPVRRLYGETRPERLQGKLIVDCNHAVKVNSFDYGIQRRLRVIPFNHRIPIEQRDTMLGQKIREEELEGILYLLAGVYSPQWYAEGLSNVPAAILEASGQVFEERETLKTWLENRVIAVTASNQRSIPHTRSSELLHDFNRWAEREGCSTYPDATGLNEALATYFESSQRATSAGIVKCKRGGNMGWLGLKLQSTLPKAFDRQNAQLQDGILFVDARHIGGKP